MTFLIPLFAVLYGRWLLHETVTAAMAVGCAAILGGTAFATGILRGRRASSAR